MIKYRNVDAVISSVLEEFSVLFKPVVFLFGFFIWENTWFPKHYSVSDETMELEKRTVSTLLPAGKISSKIIFHVSLFPVND